MSIQLDTGRIGQRFAQLRREGRGAFMPCVVAGDPDQATSLAIVRALVEAGADALELVVPFSDPVADGPVIQAADDRALRAGATPARVLDLVRAIRQCSDLPIALLVYANILWQRGLDRFCAQAREAGVDGIICPDLPVDEADELRAATEAAGLDLIFLVAPNTPDDRLDRILAASRGFVYCVARLGVTGARDDLAEATLALVRRVRPCGDLPLVVGFGISTPEQGAQVLAAGADGFIVASALIRLVAQYQGQPEELLRQVGEMARGLAEAARG